MHTPNAPIPDGDNAILGSLPKDLPAPPRERVVWIDSYAEARGCGEEWEYDKPDADGVVRRWTLATDFDDAAEDHEAMGQRAIARVLRSAAALCRENGILTEEDFFRRFKGD